MNSPNVQKRKVPKGKTPKDCDHQIFDSLGIFDGSKKQNPSQPKTLSQLAGELEQALLEYKAMVNRLLSWEYFSFPLFGR